MQPLKIGFVSSEITPFAKTGGLADVSAALGKYINQAGHDIKLVAPFYSAISTNRFNFKLVSFASGIEIWFGAKRYIYSVYTTLLPGTKTEVYFIHCPELYSRSGYYTHDSDEHIRFALLSRAAIELCQYKGWSPDIFHCNDWQTALLPLYLKTIYKWDNLFRQTKSVLTIHNIGYQGRFPAHIINDLNLAEYYKWFDASDLYHGTINFLKTGLIHADKITTVSETYAQEIQSDYFGEGLQHILRQRSGDLTGILNGVDYEEWNPETDPHIPYHYSYKKPAGKKKNTKALVSRLGLPYKPDTPVIGMITRLAEQKGLDLLRGALDEILKNFDVQFVILGSGEPEYEQYLYHMQLSFDKKLVFYRGYNYELAHLIEAGANIFLMPSRYEPCGLNQIYSLKYGTVPVVRRTGGLADTVELYQWQNQTGTGFVFDHYNAGGLLWALKYALTTYGNKQAWRKIMIRGMKKDFSWHRQIAKYIILFNNLLMNK